MSWGMWIWLALAILLLAAVTLSGGEMMWTCSRYGDLFDCMDIVFGPRSWRQ